MRKRIFVSHANGDEESDRFLPRLCEALAERDLEVLIDRTGLRPGSSWRREIYTWLSICHGAIVILSPKAVVGEAGGEVRYTRGPPPQGVLDPQYGAPGPWRWPRPGTPILLVTQ
jgi:hypothetical protein